MMRISRRLSRAIRKEPREFNYTSFSSGRGKKKQNEISPDINTSPRAQREEKSTTRSFSYLCHRHVWAVLVLGILRVAVHRSIRHFYCLSLSLSLSLCVKQCRFLIQKKTGPPNFKKNENPKLSRRFAEYFGRVRRALTLEREREEKQ